jgi:hypothetical protein
VISSHVSRVSAIVLAAAGLPLLFASDVILSILAPGLPPSSAWLGQLIAAGWLSVALFNWNARASVLGGIYGRPVVNLNLVLYMVTALGLLKAERATVTLRMLSIPFLIMTVVYGALLLRGPFDRTAER